MTAPKKKILIAPLDQLDYYALRDAVDLAVARLDENRRQPALRGERIRSKGPLQRRLENLTPKLGFAEWV
jgi:hypothetical protein